MTTSLADGRTGAVAFWSTSPASPTPYLTGVETARVPIAATLTLPRGGAERFPAVVLHHGSGGISAGREFAWVERLAEQGLATLLVDSFGPRGVRSTAEDQSQVSTVAMVADSFNALALLATHPRIDPDRIAVMGFSKGGQVALYTALEAFRRAAGIGDRAYALHVAFYPSCALPYLSRETTRRPLAVFLGGLDDYTPAAQCDRYVDWFRDRGSPVEVFRYAKAGHGFDTPGAPVRLNRVQSARACALDLELELVQGRRQDDGRVVAPGEIGNFLRGCSQRGATFGGHAPSLARAVTDLTQVLGKHLMP